MENSPFRIIFAFETQNPLDYEDFDAGCLVETGHHANEWGFNNADDIKRGLKIGFLVHECGIMQVFGDYPA